MTIHTPSGRDFRSLVRIATSSMAEPPWFATPVDAHEDDEALSISFQIPRPRVLSSVRVEVNDRSATVVGHKRGSSRPLLRVCALPVSVDGARARTNRSGDLLCVRIPKKNAQPSPDPSPSSAPAER